MAKLSDILAKYKDKIGDDGVKEISEAVDSYKIEFTEKHVSKLEALEKDKESYKQDATSWRSQQLKGVWEKEGKSIDKFDEAMELFGERLNAETIKDVAKSSYWSQVEPRTPKGDISSLNGGEGKPEEVPQFFVSGMSTTSKE